VRLLVKILVLAVRVILATANAAGQQFQLMETSISDIHNAMQSGKLTCRSLVQRYLDRIKAYDQQGPAINAMLYVNPKALEQAEAMDKAFKRGTKLKPLQCIPLVLKDNFDTADMPTTGGSLALKGMQPAKDAFTVVRLRQAGALILGKTNMHELAINGLTVSSLGGETKNPYELTRTPGGSSGGTGAALAANFAVVGTASETPAGDDWRLESGGAQRHPGFNHGISGDHGSGWILDSNCLRADRCTSWN
jgi:amidase